MIKLTSMNFMTNQLETARQRIEREQLEAKYKDVFEARTPGKTATLFALLRTGPQTTEALMNYSGLSSKQVYGLLKYHMAKGTIVRKNERFHFLDPVQIEINRCIAFLERHGYEFD